MNLDELKFDSFDETMTEAEITNIKGGATTSGICIWAAEQLGEWGIGEATKGPGPCDISTVYSDDGCVSVTTIICPVN